MVGKSQIKFIKSLQQKKYRSRHKMFIAEGKKTVKELLMSDYKEHAIYATDLDIFSDLAVEVIHITASDLKKMSGLKNPDTVLAVFHYSEAATIDYKDWVLALDGISDPGNFGTIIRLCDWFGIRHILCSQDTVDCYNPKVLQATMGSIARVNIIYADLKKQLEDCPLPVYGAFMQGSSVYNSTLAEAGVLVMGNEANGITELIESRVDSRLSIPQYGHRKTESLNVGTATAILLNEIRRTPNIIQK